MKIQVRSDAKLLMVMKILVISLLVSVHVFLSFAGNSERYDVVVYGGTSAGIASAIQTRFPMWR